MAVQANLINSQVISPGYNQYEFKMNFDEGDIANDGGDLDNIEEMLDDLGLGDENQQLDFCNKDSTVFIVDCKHIQHPLEGESESQLKIILDSYSNFLQKKIIGSAGDEVGLVLYNVNKQTKENFKNVLVYHKLAPPSANSIKDAQSLYRDFDLVTGGVSEENSELQNIFWTYSDEIKKISKDNKYYLRLFLFTAEDCPHQENTEARSQAINQSELLAGKGVQIELFPLKKTRDSVFDIRKFYQSIISFDAEEINAAAFDTTSKILDLKERLRQKEFKKRTLNRLLMKIGNETEIGVKLYSLYTKAKKPTPKKLDGTSNCLLKRVVKRLNKQGKPLFDGQIGTYYPLGGEKVKLTKEDPPGMTLLGFKPRKLIKPYYNLRTSYFIYPDEEHVTGSSQFCDGLINQLTQKDLVGIVKLVPRNNQEMVFAALFPQKEHFDEVDHYQTPPGFNMIILPYADDIVNFSGDATIVKPMEISEELLGVTNLLVNNLTITDFDFRNFENPSLQKFYAHLQTLALGETEPVERKDLLLPDTEVMDSYRDIVEVLVETVENDNSYFAAKKEEEDIVEEVPVKKEEVIDQCEEDKNKMKKSKVSKKQGAKKKVKKEVEISSEEEFEVEEKNGKKKNSKPTKSTEEINAENVEEMIVQGETDSIKAADLKKYLTFHGLESKGKKEQLLNRALIFISERPTI